MMTRRLVLGALVAGLLGGLAPVGSAPAHANCESPIGVWFWYGVRIENSLATNEVNPVLRDNPVSQAVKDNTGQDAPQLSGSRSVAAPPVNLDSSYYSCTLAPTAGLSMKNPVLPGATLVSARHNGAHCQDTTGHATGLGVGYNLVGAGSVGNGAGVITPSLGQAGSYSSAWRYPRDVLGACDTTVFDPGPRLETTPIDPTQLGVFEAWTDLSGHGARAQYYTLDR